MTTAQLLPVIDAPREPVSQMTYLGDKFAKKSEKPDEASLTHRIKAVAVEWLLILKALFDSHKGLNTLAKLGRSFDALVTDLDKYIRETQEQEGLNVNTGLKETLKAVGIAAGVLAFVNTFVNIPERIEKGKQLYRAFEKAKNGDWAWLTPSFVLEQVSFWPKQVSNDIEVIQFLNKMGLYSLGSASNGLGIAKSFLDGIANVFTIALQCLKIKNALKEEAKSKAAAEKWEARKQNIESWTPAELKQYAKKMELKTRLYFLEAAAELAKKDKLGAESLKMIEEQKESVKQALFMRKVDKILVNTARGSHLTPEEGQALISAFERVRAKLLSANLSLASRQIVLDILDNGESLPAKRGALHMLCDQKVGEKFFGVCEASLSSQTDPLFRNRSTPQTALYEELLADTQLGCRQWKFLQEHPERIGDRLVKPHVEKYAADKKKNFLEVERGQKEAISRAIASMALAVGLVALSAVALTFALARPGSLPTFLVKWKPFVFAGIGIPVGIIGLARFVVDELYKNKQVKKRIALSKEFVPLGSSAG